MRSTTIGRLAPSPTGRLHLGHARSLLAAWWSARSARGQVVLRIEDLDESRCRTEFVGGLIEDMRWLGIDWDGEPRLQSEHQAAHRAALAELHAAGWVYPCVCTRKDIQRASSAPHREEQTDAYPGTCRDRFASAQAAWRATGREPAWRFRSERAGPVRWHDRWYGAQVGLARDFGGDFVVWTKADRAAYQLAVVVDDEAQGVTEILRAHDLIPSTFQQVALREALGFSIPAYGHLGMVLDAQGQRLAKRVGSHSLAEWREQGRSLQTLLQWIASTFRMAESGSSAGEYVDRWDAERVPLGDCTVPEAWGLNPGA